MQLYINNNCDKYVLTFEYRILSNINDYKIILMNNLNSNDLFEFNFDNNNNNNNNINSTMDVIIEVDFTNSVILFNNNEIDYIDSMIVLNKGLFLKICKSNSDISSNSFISFKNLDIYNKNSVRQIQRIEYRYNVKDIKCEYNKSVIILDNYTEDIMFIGEDKDKHFFKKDHVINTEIINLFKKCNFSFGITTYDIRIRKIICGNNNTFMLNDIGKVYGCGKNNYYQLGLGDNELKIKFSMIIEDKVEHDVSGGFPTIVDIYPGEDHTYFQAGDIVLKEDMDSYTNNNYYKILDEDRINIIYLRNKHYVCGLNDKGQVGNSTQIYDTYTKNQNSTIVKVATHNSTLHNDRIISRYNKTVNFNNSDLNTDIVNVSQIYTWGEMLYKEFGLDKTSITNDINNILEIPLQVFNLPKIIDVGCGDQYTILLDSSKNIYTAGKNDSGILGNTTYDNKEYFIKYKHRSKEQIGINIEQISTYSDHLLLIKEKQFNTDLSFEIITQLINNIPQEFGIEFDEKYIRKVEIVDSNEGAIYGSVLQQTQSNEEDIEPITIKNPIIQ